MWTETSESFPVPQLAWLRRSHLSSDSHWLPGSCEETTEENGEGFGTSVDRPPTGTPNGGPLQCRDWENRYLLCPGHLPVPATGCRLTKCISDGATHENTEGLQHSNPGPVLLLLQCHFGACPKAGPAPSQSVSFSPDFPNQSINPEISAVNLLTPSCVVWPISEARKINFLTEAVFWN